MKRDLDDMGSSRPVVYGLFVVIVIALSVAFWRGGFNAPGTGPGRNVQIGNKTTPEAEILAAPFLNPGPGGGYAKGASDPILTIIEFADFQCPGCRFTSFELADFLKKHPTEVRIVFRHYPLDMTCNPTVKRQIHEFACGAARAAEAAGLQGKFWEYHDALYAKADNIFKPGTNTPDLSAPTLVERAKRIGLNVEEFKAAMESGNVIDKVVSDITDANGFNVQSTPTLFVNGRQIVAGRPQASFEAWLQMAKDGKLDPKGPSSAQK